MPRTSLDTLARRAALAESGEDADTGAARQFVNGFARGLRVIRAFGEGAERLTLTQVAARAELTRAGARRLLLTLEELGYADHVGRLYFLTPKVMSLGYAYISSMPLWNFAQPILERLVGEMNETVSLSVLDETEIVYILRIPVHRILSIGVSVGSRLPAHATSMGRVLLAGLSPDQLDRYFKTVNLRAFTKATVTDPDKLRKIIATDRERGYSWIDGEMEAQISGLSVPVRDGQGHVISALNVSFNRAKLNKDAVVKKFLPGLQKAAEQMTRSLTMRDKDRL
jgi:IclR family pca regulon transcriptional regulator